MLRLIYGRAGSGKTTYCFNEIKEKINKEKKIYIITPEQFSFTAEKHLMDIVGTKAAMNAEVLTFDRMAYRVFQEIGGSAEVALSDCGISMLLYDILEKQKDKLTFLGKSSKNVEIVHRMLTELKKHKVETEQIQQAIDDVEDNYLKKKLRDILILEEAFQNSIPANYIDGTDRLTKLAEKLPESELFNDTVIYLEEFAGFTKQEYSIIEVLLKKAKQVNITICADCLEEYSNIETDLFFENKKTALKLIELAKKNNIKVEESVKLLEAYRFKNEELAHLEENIYRIETKNYDKEIENIELFIAMNPYSEIENLAKQIIYLVREKNYRYKDIAVITKNMENYRAITKTVFNQYEIPVFIDEKRDLSKNILVQFILSIFDIYARNWSYDAMFAYLKTGLVEIENNELYKLENYCMQWGIKGKKWYTDDWNYGNLDKESLEQINSIRKKVVEPLVQLKEQLTAQKNVKNISRMIYNFLKEKNTLTRLQEKIKELEKENQVEIANDYRTSINVVMEVLDEMVNVFRDEKVSFDKYRELLKIGLENKNLGAIPGVQDEVIMGDVDRSRSHKVRAVFILGLNDGSFPSIHKEEGFLDDKDRQALKKEKIELAKGNLEQLYYEQFNIYKALSVAEEKLYLSYTSTDKDGKAIRPSVLLINIKEIFPKLKEKSDVVAKNSTITLKIPTFDALLEKIYEWKQGEVIDEIWYNVYAYYRTQPEWSEKLDEAIKGLAYTNLPEKIEQDKVNKLYGNNIQTSISQLEQYRRCPFAYHLKYGLKLNEPVNSGIQAIDTGSFMHEVIDEFFEQIKEENIQLQDLSKEDLKEKVSKIIDKKLEISKYCHLISNAKFRTLIRKLKKTVLTSIEYIVVQLVNSRFNVLGSEISFKNKGDYPPIVLNLEDGQKVEIVGKIDRVDIAENEDGKYIRIIDYKSSIKKLDLNEVVYGLQIQLLTYLNQMSNVEQADEAGILYFNLIDSLINTKKRLSEEELEAEIKKKYKMQGLILADVKVVKLMDTKLEKGYSDTIPVYIDKDGNVSKKSSSAVEKEDFKNLQKQVIRTIKQISKEILQGDISLKPYYNKDKKTPCKYCTYHSICNFSTKNKDNSYSYVPNLTQEEILNRIKIDGEAVDNV